MHHPVRAQLSPVHAPGDSWPCPCPPGCAHSLMLCRAQGQVDTGSSVVLGNPSAAALGRGMLASFHCGVQCHLPLPGAAHCVRVQPRGSSAGLCVAGTVALGLCPCLHASCSRNLLHSRLALGCGRVSRVVGSSSHWQCALGRVWQPLVQQPAVGCCILRCHPWVLFAVVPSTWHWWKFTSGCCRMQHVVWFRLSISVRKVLRVLGSLPKVCMPRL